MHLFISHESALEYWRKRGVRGDGVGRNVRHRRLKPSSKPVGTTPLYAEAKDLLGLDLGLELESGLDLSLPIDILVGSGKARKSSQAVRNHVCCGPFPADSFVDVGSGVLVSSPEFCFLQLANSLPLVKLVELGFELCGSYSLEVSASRRDAHVDQAPDRDTSGELTGTHSQRASQADAEHSGTRDTDSEPTVPHSQQGFSSREPLTSTTKLKSFIHSASKLRGSTRASQAVQFIANGSASPMETILAMLLTLPYRLGGFGLPMPKLNGGIVLGKSREHLAAKTHYYCDLLWARERLAVEYDSDQFHTGPLRIAEDSRRRNALLGGGITVVTVTWQQVYNAIEFERIAGILANRLGKRLRYKAPAFSARHFALRGQLMPYKR